MELTINPTDYRPRLIIWEIACSCLEGNSSIKKFNTKECFTIMDSIAEISKPIIVLASNYSENSKCDPLDRADIVDILLYGNSLGLKMIVETSGEKLTPDLRSVLKTIGTKCIRILINDHIKEDIESKFVQNEKFNKLDNLINQLKSEGFEIQLGIVLNSFNERELLFIVDYAVQKSSKGIYFHLQNPKSSSKLKKISYNKEEAINWIANQKKLLPDDMYFSPQCIKYGIKHKEDEENAETTNHTTHWCLSGKTFAYINGKGEVQICNSIKNVCGDLRKTNLSFAQIWYNSEIFNWLRYNNFSCTETQISLTRPIPKSSESKEIYENI